MADYGEEAETMDGHRGSVNPAAMSDFMLEHYDELMAVFDALDQSVRTNMITKIVALDKGRDENTCADFAYCTFGGCEGTDFNAVASSDAFNEINSDL